ncbi:MAG: bifunctional tRNA (5-methylaminomethyl-2-thiouridine)(34)-methyltransferase MnmD/FAD-dependent 5-carboxymethylaminomethyl-2-thiouridine(34) oxidoreductase MnmC [Alkalimonas sp.]|nr:bifunctional tRNA (5-methylaminomethyl-2-thiouridine)(34)-methyltransferase MnmD/FAD-dependent 5-carboxymethylaminomethyl-2-thiouridine(34) oxidoreductase MnmC [Alkalimonas sp.]
MKTVQHASIYFNEQGTPVAKQFDDVYFSNDDGMAETDYVFLKHNGLPERWQQHHAAFFHIGETGFGTGSNFLLTWQRFRQFRQQQPEARCQRLYFTSFEKFPLSQADLTQALASLTGFDDECQALLSRYPAATAGCHRLVFDDGQVILDLWFGDVLETLPQRDDSVAVDAWFLDGFAPSKNPDMWQPALFEQLARHSKAGSTIATFTAAGVVKRGLQAAGFQVQKVKGFGRKRDMLMASYAKNQVDSSNRLMEKSASDVTIIGGGLAAMCLSLALLQKGCKVRLLCADAELAGGASKNRQGALYPNLHAEPTQASLIQAAAFQFARCFFPHRPFSFAHDWCGVQHQACTAQLLKRHAKMSQHWPQELVQTLSAEDASEQAGVELPYPAILYPTAGWLSPQQFCQAAGDYLQQQPGFELCFNQSVCQLQAEHGRWSIITSGQTTFSCDTLVLALGHQTNRLLSDQPLPIRGIRGQVSYVEQAALAPLKTVLCHKGYLTPAWQGLHAVGATFDRNRSDEAVLAEDDQANLQLVQQSLLQPSWFEQSQVKEARSGVRATVPDRLPLAGRWTEQQQSCFVLTGLGARGLLFAPLLAEALACELVAEPSPLPLDWQRALRPERYRSDQLD